MRKPNVAYQIYVNRSDIKTSTVGSISSAMLPMRTMDIGLPLLAMHSAVETMMEARDQEQLNHLTVHFLGDRINYINIILFHIRCM